MPKIGSSRPSLNSPVFALKLFSHTKTLNTQPSHIKIGWKLNKIIIIRKKHFEHQQILITKLYLLFASLRIGPTLSNFRPSVYTNNSIIFFSVISNSKNNRIYFITCNISLFPIIFQFPTFSFCSLWLI